MPVKQVRAFHPQVSLPVLHGVTAAVGDFCVKLAWKLLTLSRRLFKSLAASAQTWLTTIPDSNAQVIASFSLFFLNVRHSRRGSLFCPYCRTAGGGGTEELADFALIYPTLHSFKGRRRQHFAVTVMALLADDTLRFHLFDNTRGTVIADAELTLNPGNRRFALRSQS